MTPQTLTSSVIVTQALGLEPDGISATKAGSCAYCGLSISPGDLVVPFQAGPSFMDDHSLAAKGSDMTCGHCAQLMSVEWLRETGFGVFHAGGKLPFRKWGDIAAALTEPPDAPFVAVYATANNQHMAWRAPVNFSRDLFYVRVGLRDLKVRRPKLHAAVAAARALGDVLVAAGKYKEGGKTLPHPFVTLTPDFKDPAAGSFRHVLFSEDVWIPEYAPHVRTLNQMTLGEFWALRFVMTPGAGQDATAD